jgi:Tfp pilus assembly PilM family ATPase
MSGPRQGFGAQGFLASWLASPPPDAAIEVAADRVAAAALTARGSKLVVTAHAAESLAPGVVTPSLVATNIHDRAAVVGALRRVIERLGSRVRRVALVVPDTAIKVSLVRFEKVPQKRDDLDQLVRWQLRKAAPFPVDAASVTYSPGLELEGGGREFVVELARHETIREYETVCEEVGTPPGLVDTATFSLLGLFSGSGIPSGDWLLVHVRPDYTTIVIARGEHVIFYRSRPEDEGTDLEDLVHQTAMYYQDRLQGRGFARVLLAGSGGIVGALEVAQRSIEDRLGVSVIAVDPTRTATLTDRIGAPSPDLMNVLAPLVGILRRTRAEAAA